MVSGIDVSETNNSAPVRIVKGQTKTVEGTEVQEKMISAARVFSDILSPTYGPGGLDKMLYKTDGNTAITNDGSRIVSELLVKHPAAKMMVSMAKTQEETSGDGVTGTMIICGALLEEAARLLSRGLHPLTVVDGYRKSMVICKATISTRALPVSDDDITDVAITAMTGKSIDVAHFSTMLSKAWSILRESGDQIGPDNFGMYKSESGTLLDSRLVRGVVLRRRVPNQNAPNNLLNPTVAVIRNDIKIRKMSRNAEIKITDSENLDLFIDAEQDRKKLISKSIIESGAKLVLCGGEVDPDILHDLTISGTLVISELDTSEIEQVALCTNSTIIDGIFHIEKEMIGRAGKVIWSRRPSTEKVEDVIEIDDCPSTRLVTFSIGGNSDVASEETIRSLHDAIRSISSIEGDPRMVTGGGSIHARMASDIRKSSLEEPSRERLAMEAFARALETIPFTLAANAGRTGLDAVLELRTKSREEVDKEYGISKSGDVDLVDGVVHPVSSVISSLEAAVETSISMLRIDQVVSAKRE